MKFPDPAVSPASQAFDVLLAMCIFGEARGEPDDARLAVGNVIRNRVLAGRYGGTEWARVILAPLQFSCFNENDPNRKKVMEPMKWAKPEVWYRCFEIAESIMGGSPPPDNTRRATHYFDKSMDGKPPFWAKHFIKTVEIGGLRFYRDPLAFKENDPDQDAPIELAGES